MKSQCLKGGGVIITFNEAWNVRANVKDLDRSEESGLCLVNRGHVKSCSAKTGGTIFP